MNYSELIQNIESREGKRKSYDFKRIKAILGKLDNPQQGLKYIHIAGTNGKGSTSNFIYNMLRKEGYRVGLYTSPHLERYTERIIISGEEISQEDFVKYGLKTLEAEEKILDEFEMMTYFEFITVIMFLYFKEKNCDICVLEVGMGGLSDSTNVILKEDKLVSIITPIGLDHTQYLGETIEEITEQKAGIIVDNVPVVTSNIDEKILKILEEKAKEKNTKLYTLSNVKVENLEISDKGTKYTLSYKNEKIIDIEVSIIGYYQLYNSVLSILSLLILRERNILKISDESIKRGIKDTFWAGRMEIIRKNPIIVLDGAHNMNGISSLVENIKLFNYGKLYVITSILEDKEHEKMLEKLSEKANEIILVNLNTKRKTDLLILEKEALKYNDNVKIIDSLEDAINNTIKKSKSNDLIIISGSLYLVSEVKDIVDKII